jgi:NAD kinase
MEPRVVVVTRPTEYESLLYAFGTEGQAKWVLAQRGQDIGPAKARHEAHQQAVEALTRAVPSTWRSTAIGRKDLDRFLFEPEDLVVAIGQDGLVANVAKYLTDQPVLGVNPGGYEGVLVKHSPAAAAKLLGAVADRSHPIEARTMIEARTDDGQRLRALNEIYLGHRTHQSSRYALQFGGQSEHQSSSGLLCASGTGCTGWALSVANSRQARLALPKPTDRSLVFFVREAWPSKSTGATLVEGLVDHERPLAVTSEFGDGGVMFGDGIESDAVALPFGRLVTLGPAPGALRLVA